MKDKEQLSLLDLKEKIDFFENKNMVELSFDLDEKICKMLEEMAKDENKSENEIVIDAIEQFYYERQKMKEDVDTSDFMTERVGLPLEKREDLF